MSRALMQYTNKKRNVQNNSPVKKSKIPHEVQGYQIKQRAYGVDNQSTKEIKI